MVVDNYPTNDGDNDAKPGKDQAHQSIYCLSRAKLNPSKTQAQAFPSAKITGPGIMSKIRVQDGAFPRWLETFVEE